MPRGGNNGRKASGLDAKPGRFTVTVKVRVAENCESWAIGPTHCRNLGISPLICHMRTEGKVRHEILNISASLVLETPCSFVWIPLMPGVLLSCSARS
ncbi:unnamed protein product [Ectocarpus fasciculatus]